MTDNSGTVAVEQLIVGLLRERGALAGVSDGELSEHDYVASGALDSLGIVEFVTELEDKLGARFGSDDLLSPEFRTVGGLVRMSDSLRA